MFDADSLRTASNVTGGFFLPGAAGAFVRFCLFNWRELVRGTNDETENALETACATYSERGMVGQIVYFHGSLPDNVLDCDGSTFDEIEYPDLYDYLGTNVLPNLAGMFLLSGEVGETGGESEHTLTLDEIPSHAHGVTIAVPSATTIVVPDAPSAVPGAGSTALAGGGQSHNNMPPYYCVSVGIVAR